MNDRTSVHKTTKGNVVSMNNPRTLRVYYLNRTVDATGNSGTGKVARVVHDSASGVAMVLWSAETNALKLTSDVIYRSLADLMLAHGHNGATELLAYSPDDAELVALHRRVNEAIELLDQLARAFTDFS
jgi:hypothetical protein